MNPLYLITDSNTLVLSTTTELTPDIIARARSGDVSITRIDVDKTTLSAKDLVYPEDANTAPDELELPEYEAPEAEAEESGDEPGDDTGSVSASA